ncbi:MAG: 5'-methylthioadenosine/adenosylhomocysteine nucleosidase [Clostridia bacterium]
MIVIIGAMEVEVEVLKQAMEIKEIKTIACSDFYIGTLYGKEVVVVKCNPGKVNSAQCAQAAILAFSPELIINPGVAGGVAQNIEIGDLVVASSCCQHDSDLTAFGSPIGAVSTAKGELIYFDCDKNYSETFSSLAKEVYDGTVHFGVVASGDAFIADVEKSNFISTTFNALACEMESGSIAQVCQLNNCPFVALRSISDNANHSGEVDFVSFAKSSAYKTSELIKKFFTM